MKIFICDDEGIFLEEEKKICEEFFDLHSVPDIQIILGDSGESVIGCESEIDLLLLDIDMPGLDGISVKNTLQKKNSETIILFITNHEERMREAFGMNVLGFVDKANMREEIPLFLEKIMTEISYRWIDGEDGTTYNSREIYYIKADGKNYVKLFMKNGEKLIRGNLKELEEILKDVDYIRVHREYLVNMREISELEGKAVLENNTSVPVSVRKQKEVKRMFREFQRTRMRYR